MKNVNCLMYRVLVAIVLMMPALAIVGCDSDRDHDHVHHRDYYTDYHYYPDHGEMRWNEYFGYYQYYNAYEEHWVSPIEWEYIQLGGWYDPECDCYTQGP